MSSDRTPADAQEAWLTDACSVIGQHCGSDGSDDEHNDWINDLANALWDTLVQHPVTRAEVDLTNLREVVAGVRAEFEQAVTDPELDTGMANWLDALNAHLGAAVRGVTAEPDSAADRTPNELADRLDNIARNGYDPDAHDVQRAAAVLLRRQGEQLDTLRKAIGDPDELRRVAVSVARDRKVTSAEAERRIGLLTRIAAAVGDPEERPAQCPECGSDDPATRLPVKRPEVHIEGGARVCRFCNRTLTFNFMRNDGGDCDCARAVEDAACSGSWHDVEVSR